jgi:NAD(P)-dependent dehydrogenase (short-subunit alcohol dehydrogenase family)
MRGKVVVITGGTSGIGEVAAQRLANMAMRALHIPFITAIYRASRK